MNVSLTPELEKYVAEKIESGSYNNASEVIQESLQLLKDRDAEWSREIEIGWQQARAGLGVDGPTFMRRVRERLEKAKKEQDKQLKRR